MTEATTENVQGEIRFFMGRQKVEILPCVWHEGDEFSHGCPEDEICFKIRVLEPCSITRVMEDYDEDGPTGTYVHETHTYQSGEIFCCPAIWLWKKPRHPSKPEPVVTAK